MENNSSETTKVTTIDGIQIYVSKTNTKYKDRNDLILVLLNALNNTVGVFTQNKFCAAPVKIAKKHLDSDKRIMALIINAGIANAGTGEIGINNALSICKAVAEKINCDTSQILPFSTGVILEQLPVEEILIALKKTNPVPWDEAAKAIMTTDTKPKFFSKRIEINEDMITFIGMAKGAGMIHPNMATMLSFVATDATISKDILNGIIQEITEESFNSITIDGDTSTNDSFILTATNRSKKVVIDSIDNPLYDEIKKHLKDLAKDLAKAIVYDGEGATKFITIQVNGAETVKDAKEVAYSIARSPLVKTAFYASDANLGRILCAIGNAKVNFDINKVRLFLNNILVAENGGLAELYKDEDGQRIMSQKEITIRIDLQMGDYNKTIYTTDLSHEYIDINANYRS